MAKKAKQIRPNFDGQNAGRATKWPGNPRIRIEESEEIPTMENLKDEIQAYCDQVGIEYTEEETKAELLEKINSQ